MAFLGRLLHKDTLSDLGDVIVNLELLAKAEAQISEFYRLCAVAMPKEESLWNSLAKEELRHAVMVKKMIDLLGKDPKLYKPGISFSPVTTRIFLLEMQNLVERLNHGQIFADELFAIALEIEDSTIEANYEKIVKTKDEALLSLAGQIDRESVEHKRSISLRVNAVSEPAQ